MWQTILAADPVNRGKNVKLPAGSASVSSRHAVSAMRGFTLIELVIVIAIVAILAAIAIPSYQDSVRKARRGQAKADMVEYAQLAERFHTINNTYLNFETGLPAVSPREAGATPAYDLNYATTQNTFLITATPAVGSMQTGDTRCLTLTLSETGLKTESGSGTVPDCW